MRTATLDEPEHGLTDEMLADTDVRELSKTKKHIEGEIKKKIPVAKRCKAIGESVVQVTGELSQEVSKIGIGTRCGCEIDGYLRMGCDCSGCGVKIGKLDFVDSC